MRIPRPRNGPLVFLKSLLFAIGTFSLLIFGSEDSLGQEQAWLSYFSSVVRVQGKLTKVLKYGPPSYGEVPEKDSRLEVAFLILRGPVRIKEDGE